MSKHFLNVFWLCGHVQIETEVENGTRERYRSRQQILDAKTQKIGNFENTWFLKDDITSVMKIPCTPGSKLVQNIKAKCGQSRGPEKGGQNLLSWEEHLLPCCFPTKTFLGATKVAILTQSAIYKRTKIAELIGLYIGLNAKHV